MEYKLSKAEYIFLNYLHKMSRKNKRYKINFTDPIMSSMGTPLQGTMKLLKHGYIKLYNDRGYEVPLPVADTYAGITSDGIAYVDSCKKYERHQRATMIIGVLTLIISLLTFLWGILKV